MDEIQKRHCYQMQDDELKQDFSWWMGHVRYCTIQDSYQGYE
jgi:hypothetical protein